MVATMERSNVREIPAKGKLYLTCASCCHEITLPNDRHDLNPQMAVLGLRPGHAVIAPVCGTCAGQLAPEQLQGKLDEHPARKAELFTMNGRKYVA